MTAYRRPWPSPAPRTTGTSAFPSVDLIQEFKVETNYSAEFGRSGGGIINLIYKSGTNSLHGNAYEFLRNSDLDSNNFFSNRAGLGLPAFRRNQFGGTVGGPVYIPKLYHGQNKTFFMFGYEALKESTATTLTTSVPTALQAQGNFSQTRAASGAPVMIYDPLTTVASGSAYVRTPFPGSYHSAFTRIDPVAANVFKYYPAANQPGNANTGLNNYFDTTANPENIYDVDRQDRRVPQRQESLLLQGLAPLVQSACPGRASLRRPCRGKPERHPREFLQRSRRLHFHRKPYLPDRRSLWIWASRRGCSPRWRRI